MWLQIYQKEPNFLKLRVSCQMLCLKFFAISFLKSVWKAKYVWNEFVQALLERMQIDKNCGVEGYS